MNARLNILTGERIKQLRKASKLNQEEFAKKIGYKNRLTVSRIEKGHYACPPDTLERILIFFDMQISDFYGFKFP